jgi:thiamine pyrophosphate-dependent acetolactate synthase large subunit-like protein
VPTFPVEERDGGVYLQVEEEEHQEQTLSDVTVETLANWGVRWIWGMVGHSNLGLADAFRRAQGDEKLKFFGIRHEGAAAFAVSAYGKLTGRPAACFSIAGPGATNLLTGMWDAHVDGAPALAITGQVPTQLVGRGAFQEVDLGSAFGGVAKYTATAWAHSNIPEIVGLACKTALIEGGVSHLIFPDDVQTLPSAEVEAGSPQGRIGDHRIAPPETSLVQAKNAISEAKRPVIIVGHGARSDMPAVLKLAEKLNCPVLTTFKGKGLISDRHALGCGVLGRSGTPIASWFMNEADLLVVLGASFANHTGISSYKKIVQVDRDPMRLGRFHPVEVPVWGDIGTTLHTLLPQLDKLAAVDQRSEIATRWQTWREEKERRGAKNEGKGISSAAIFEALTRVAPSDAIIAVDVGNNTYSFGRYFECDSQSVLMSGYLGSIGFGYPAAMGAWAATQETDSPFANRKVIAVTGDGGFGQYMAEYLTAAKYKMNITHVLVHNDELGKISKEQRAAEFDVWETDLKNPNFADYANLCGVSGTRVDKEAELQSALSQALAHKGPSMVEIMADPQLI